MTLRLYRTPIPEDALEEQRGGARAELSRLTQLQGQGSVTQLGTQSGDLTLDLQYRGKYADRLQLELRELIESPTVATMPLAPVDGDSTIDGYYTVEAVTNAGAASAQSGRLQRLQATLVREGTLSSQFQAVTVAPSDDITNPYGTTDTRTVAIPSATIGRPRAVDAISSPGTVEPIPDSAVVETVQTQHGQLDRVDTTALSTTPTAIVYRPVGYDPVGDPDAGAWDTYGAETIRDTDGVVQWGRVFGTEHAFRGAAVVENGRLRLTLAEPDTGDGVGKLSAERWDPTASGGDGAWTAVDLPSFDGDLATDWRPVDVDLTRIGQAAVHALVEFEAVAGDAAGELYTLDVRLFRGWDTALVTIPPRESGPLPPALFDLVEPIASGRVVDPGVEQTLIARSEVR